MYKPGTTNLYAFVFENKRAILLPRCHGSVSHVLIFCLIGHTNTELMTVPFVCVLYFFILFRGSDFNLQL